MHEVFTQDEIEESAATNVGYTDADRRYNDPADFYRSLITKHLNVNGETATQTEQEVPESNAAALTYKDHKITEIEVSEVKQ